MYIICIRMILYGERIRMSVSQARRVSIQYFYFSRIYLTTFIYCSLNALTFIMESYPYMTINSELSFSNTFRSSYYQNYY